MEDLVDDYAPEYEGLCTAIGAELHRYFVSVCVCRSRALMVDLFLQEGKDDHAVHMMHKEEQARDMQSRVRASLESLSQRLVSMEVRRRLDQLNKERSL